LKVETRTESSDEAGARRRAFTACVVLLVLSALTYIALLGSLAAARVGFALRYDSIVLPTVLALLFLAGSRCLKLPVLPALIFISVTLCGLVLSGVWQAGVSDHTLLAGLYSHSDSFSYLDGSARLLNGGRLNDVASRRPLTPGIFAVLLSLSGGNLRGALAVAVFLSALALVMPVREMIRTHGWAAGCALFLALFLFYRRFIGSTLTEHLGLSLGCLGFALLWRAAHTGWRVPVFLGVFLLTLGLNARAGAFFILPALALWAGWSARGKTRLSLRLTAWVLAVVFAGFAFNYATRCAIGNPKARQGHGWLMVYGLVHGGDWSQVLSDHPELVGIPELERNRATRELTLAHLAEHPGALPTGMLRAWRQFFFSADGPYSFVRFAFQRSLVQVPAGTEPPPSDLLQKILGDPLKFLQIGAAMGTMATFYVLAGWAVFALFRARGPAAGLLLFAGLGILASVPMIPPWDADLMRMYATTLPFLMALPAIGLADLAARALGRTWPAPRPGTGWTDGRGLLAAAALAILLCGSPFLLGRRTETMNSRVPAEGTWTLRLLQGSALTGRWGRCLETGAVRRNLGVLALAYPERAAELLAAVSAGDTLVLGYETASGTLKNLVMDSTDPALQTRGPVCMRVKPVRPGDSVFWWRVESLPAGTKNDPRP
jgi:hypothetical protein